MFKDYIKKIPTDQLSYGLERAKSHKQSGIATNVRYGLNCIVSIDEYIKCVRRELNLREINKANSETIDDQVFEIWMNRNK